MNIFFFAAILQAVQARNRATRATRGKTQRRRAARHAAKVAAQHAAQSKPSDNVARFPPCCSSDGVCDHPVGAGQAPQPAPPPPGRPASPPPERPETGKDFPNLDEYYI